MKVRSKITEPDWVGLRALYLILATDTSSATSREVQRIMGYYSSKYGYGSVVGALGKLARDNAIRGTFDNSAWAASRKLDSMIKITYKDPDFPEQIAEVKL